jgi:hypothetical protein
VTTTTLWEGMTQAAAEPVAEPPASSVPDDQGDDEDNKEEGDKDTAHRRVVTGVIVRRRSLGRALAFCDVKLVDDADEAVVALAFRRASFQGDNFPVKKAALPYGARLTATLCAHNNDDSSSPPFAVHSWQLVSSPHNDAVAQARVVGSTEGISCTDYLRHRRQAYDAVHVPAASTATSLVCQPTRSMPPSVRRRVSSTSAREESDNGHGTHRTKAVRAQVFGQWIVANLLRWDGSDRVLDVAGGKGLLSHALAATGVPCTVVDPLVRKQPSTKRLVQQNKPVPAFVAACFSTPLATAMERLVQTHTCVVGLHPDQCTEAILDEALRVGATTTSSTPCAIAIVPCCVFPTLFPARSLVGPGGTPRPVRTYEDFLAYLLQKDPRLRQVRLPFDGKNECIYLKI